MDQPNSPAPRRPRRGVARADGLLFARNNPAGDPRFYERKRALEARLGRTLSTGEYIREHWTGTTSRLNSGTSIFDPVLAELLVRWYSPAGGLVLDPFAGGSTRGIVSAALGRSYVGVDLSERQVEADRAQADYVFRPDGGLRVATPPRWVVGDSTQIDSLLEPDLAADLVLSCPPYFDLERYSDDPRDLSAQTWEAFLDSLRRSLAGAIGRLRDDRFVAIVVSDVRGPDGSYRGLPARTLEILEGLGVRLWNEAILLNALSSVPLRAARLFGRTLKLSRVHQNVLIGVRGDPRAAVRAIGPVEFGQPSDDDASGILGLDGLAGVSELDALDDSRRSDEPPTRSRPRRPIAAPLGETVPVRIGERNARLEFQGCSPDYIRDVCHGRCCWTVGADRRISTTFYVEPDQRQEIVARGGEISPAGVVSTSACGGRCTFQGASGLCGLHSERSASGGPVKPRSCTVSPWSLTSGGSLIIRNRYKLLRCYRAEPRVPAYLAFRSGLETLFGPDETARIVAHFDAGGGDYQTSLPRAGTELIRSALAVWHGSEKSSETEPGP